MNFRRRDPKQRFARAWKPSTLLQCYGFARELPSTRFRSKGSLGPGGRRRYYDGGVSLGNFRRRGSEAKVRSGLKAVDANTGFASVGPSTLFQLSLETGVRPLPLMESKRFRSTWMGGRREDTPLYERRQTPQPPSINSNNTKNKKYDIERYTIRKRPLHETQQKQYHHHHHHYHHQQHQRPSNKQHTNNNVFDVLMREKDDGQYDLERGFLRATSWHVSPLQILCYHNTCTIYYINSNTISQATLDTRVVTPNTCTDAVYYRY